MRNPTEMMRAILTDETAQKIIDYVSPVYGESYVGLWIYQAIGTVLGRVYAMADQLRYEVNPTTSELLLPYWEQHYGIPKDSSLSVELRRKRLADRIQSRGPINPVVLANAVSIALGGAEVDITENIAKNTFLVNIREVVPDLTPAVAVLERRKPAHLIYQIRVATQNVTDAELKTAIALTHTEKYKVEVYQ